VEDLAEDAQGRLWVATREGLFRLDPATRAITLYTTRHGLPTDYVVGVIVAPDGDLWLSTKKGLARFSPSAGMVARAYEVSDGLQGNEFNALARARAADGTLYFGGAQGLTAFTPATLAADPYAPPVVLTDFQLRYHSVTPNTPDSPLNKPIWATDQLTLRYDQNILGFEFAALSYAAPLKNQYRYRLDGFDLQWITTTRRFAGYTTLPAGDYVLRVEATNSDGVWSGRAAALRLTVLPPWWETWWFRGLVALGGVSLAVGGVTWRIRAVEQRNRDLERQVSDRTRALQTRTLELQASEEQLRYAKNAAEAANRAKSTFLANMSHELRSPLNAILGFAQVLRRHPHLPADTHENLGIILRSGEHLLALINQVLDLSKIEAGRLSLNPSDFDLYRLLTDLHDMLALRADDKHLRLIFDHADDLPRYIRADEIKLRQVLINLLTNALKFTVEGGVTLRARHTMLEEPAIHLRFEVEDTGPGIRPEEMELLFQAFAQTETGRHAQEGTGLGLPISRKFAQLMGGDIAVQSQVGHGTVFQFTITCLMVPTLPPAAQRPARRVLGLAPKQPRYRLLVVDDQWANRRVLTQLLTPLGFEVREAENGQQAVALAAAYQPHLIWMDMRMPVLDGFEATRQIKASAAGQSIVIVALTASSLEEERAVIMAAGCDEYLRKPFREDEIFTLLHTLLGAQFLYAESPSSAGQLTEPALLAALQAVPANLRGRLREATELGDLAQIAATIAEVRAIHRPLAATLQTRADQFEYDQILAWLSQA
jgi:signal transduction histidine kinase/CheY-like chemotaxis protein